MHAMPPPTPPPQSASPVFGHTRMTTLLRNPNG
eukprot:CAMPEP_0174750614 /NCGR_PEP_ID=MMETSP1094-20130205/98101_1 /TAXON_ID=156173 /ORGANISM="Chrysochromulina brevifilum, Strain UTEX LB 985" /LENGTH=32 /DNA_ID= /DNA_START= /DNA_END= /DNA_ORIENTATION=